MTSSVQSPADVVNLALRRIGYKLRIGNLYDGSNAAKIALDTYGQTRDAILRSFDWGFAERIVAASADGNTAPFPWKAEFTYPADCLQVRDMFPLAYATDPNNPLPLLWTTGWDGTAKVIWAQSTVGTLVYTFRATDPTQWEPLFVEELVLALAKRFAFVLDRGEFLKIADEDEKIIVPLAEATLG